ncbi:MAG: 16S rRNA (guanine(966)-N(2))-methyltransferase RsmD [Clostridiales bacterium]|nr:16S rRNA (guanine(966)-N(2))-methyltransferase RsmD [Clostridiales bacterium]MCD8367041.1 16S rRNA (guanine(966)-N(2))-methyltransferase RsmD [Clostridiales bacterium]
MRVITGTAKGRKLGELTGSDTRPTYDRVKEGIFNTIQFDIEGRNVLDLFGGTGQLGIECLSRGAARCVFVDQRRDAVKLIKENLRATELERNATVQLGDAIAYLNTTRERFHLIFLDPPYDSGLLEAALKKIASIDILAENGIIVCESRYEQKLPELPEPYTRSRDYKYGKIKATFYRKESQG